MVLARCTRTRAHAWKTGRLVFGVVDVHEDHVISVIRIFYNYSYT